MPTSACPADAAVETDGARKLALIVGVGEYANAAIPDLVGPPNDAQRLYDLLTRPVASGGYGFPVANVCFLRDQAATNAQFRAAFKSHLIDRAREGKDDLAVFFFAGHGSQAPDRNNDEPDSWDETLMLHDARTGGEGDLLDDEFHELLRALHAKTRNIVTILDSCNSGTATRGDGALIARFFQPAETGGRESGGGDAGEGWAPQALPGLGLTVHGAIS